MKILVMEIIDQDVIHRLGKTLRYAEEKKETSWKIKRHVYCFSSFPAVWIANMLRYTFGHSIYPSLSGWLVSQVLCRFFFFFFSWFPINITYVHLTPVCHFVCHCKRSMSSGCITELIFTLGSKTCMLLWKEHEQRVLVWNTSITKSLR